MMNLPKIALGAWSWGSGTVGGDQVFGNHLEAKDLQPIFDAAMDKGLNLWDTATVYGMGASEDILGGFVKNVKREDVIVSTKFTPQIATTLSSKSWRSSSLRTSASCWPRTTRSTRKLPFTSCR